MITPTNKCNLNCPYCYQTRDNTIYPLELFIKQIIKLKSYLDKNINYDINFMGGELSIFDSKLIDKYIKVIFTIFKEFKINVRFTTNLTAGFEWYNFLNKYDITLYGSIHIDVLSLSRSKKCLDTYNALQIKKKLDILGNDPKFLSLSLPDYTKIIITDDEYNSQYTVAYKMYSNGNIYLNEQLLVKG